jgi:hypothetical protein
MVRPVFVSRTGTARRLAAWALLLALALFAASSCVAPPRQEFTIGPCATCLSTGRLGRQSCPTCQGLGFIRVQYSYPVIDPVK